MKLSRKLKQFLILLIDIGVLYAALWLSLALRSGAIPAEDRWMSHVLYFTPIFALWIVVFYTSGLYILESPFDDVRFIGRLMAAVGVSALFATLVFYLDSSPISPKTVLAILALTSFLLMLGWRNLLGRLLRASLLKLNTAFVGMNEEAFALIDQIRDKPYLGYAAAFIFDEAPRPEPSGIPVLSDPSALEREVLARDIDLIVIADDFTLSEEALSALFGLIEHRIQFENLPRFYEDLFRRVPIGAIGKTWFLENIDLGAKKSYEVPKRLIDLAISLIMLALSLPLWPFIALGIKLGSPGPVFFRQVRLGRGNKPFSIIKFRTMRTDRNDFAPTGEKDPRILPFGNFLRVTRLDELPQFLNIIRGEMSFIGPRPERPELAEELERAVPFYRQRLLAKPGLSGWDQVSGEYHSPSVEDTYKKLQYDLYYIKNMSPSLDVSIFFKTILTVFRRAGR